MIGRSWGGLTYSTQLNRQKDFGPKKQNKIFDRKRIGERIDKIWPNMTLKHDWIMLFDVQPWWLGGRALHKKCHTLLRWIASRLSMVYQSFRSGNTNNQIICSVQWEIELYRLPIHKKVQWVWCDQKHLVIPAILVILVRSYSKLQLGHINLVI